MDTMRGNFGSLADSDSYDLGEEDVGTRKRPATIGLDERRMQVRAYNHWAGLLGDRRFPAVEDLEAENLSDFGPYSVLLDFTNGVENPAIVYLGTALAQECGVQRDELQKLSDVPARSVLTRITDHYMQILANQAPIGFEAECINQRGETILYRGVLMPFSSDDDTIDFIYGVINWKSLPDARAADELLLEIDQALDGSAPDDYVADGEGDALAPSSNVLPLPSFGYGAEQGEDDELELGAYEIAEEDGLEEDGEDEETENGTSFGSLLKMPLNMSKPTEKASVALPELDVEDVAFTDLEPLPDPAPPLDPAQMRLEDWLAAARDMAAAARNSENRTRGALYDAIGRAYDFSLAAAAEPQAFAELLHAAELTAQERAPLTPVVKLVFGADYDKTRLTEYAAALSHAYRLQLPFGSLSGFLCEQEGGLKSVVQAERRLRKEEAGKAAEAVNGVRPGIARKLRAMPAQDFAAIEPAGSEFALVVIRRSETGEIAMLGEVPEDIALLERAARRLIG